MVTQEKVVDSSQESAREVFYKLMPQAMSVGLGISTWIISVDSVAADSLLRFRNTRNRAIRKSNVNGFAIAIDNGTFQDGSPIRFAQVGDSVVLIDGHHRLEAIKRSGKCVFLTVILKKSNNLSDIQFDSAIADTGGIKRSPADSAIALYDELASYGATNINSFAAGCRLIATCFDRNRNGSVSRIDIANTVKSYQPEFDLILDWVVGKRKMVGGSCTRGIFKGGALAVALLTARYQPEKAKIFWTGVATDDGLRIDDPRKRLYLYLSNPMGGGNVQTLNTAKAAAHCWNISYLGRPLSQLKIKNILSMPEIEGVPTNEQPWAAV